MRLFHLVGGAKAPLFGLLLCLLQTSAIARWGLNSPLGLTAIAQTSPWLTVEGDRQTLNLQRLAQATTVRILTPNASGSGAIARRQGPLYTVLTSWHVVAFSDKHTLLTPDGRQYSFAQPPRQIGNTDMAVVQFRSAANYEVAAIAPAPSQGAISSEPLTVGEPVLAAGFPMYRRGTLETTFNLGIRVFHSTRGQISLLPPKPMSQGYRLGYTNDIEVGMSGGPIFNARGFLIGINGRLKNRDPGFGVYAFEDVTEPSPETLERAIASSWGIPVSTYIQFVGGGLNAFSCLI
ncbi:MAG: serine protease [Cyanobacteriota bacterium]|nr:serine protease [Cyanobacteriota bacterium]